MVPSAIRRTVEPITHMPGQLAGNLHHLGCTGLGLVPGPDAPDLDTAFLHLPRAGGKLGQRRAVQLNSAHGLHQLRTLVAALPCRRRQLKRLVPLCLQGPMIHAILDAGALKGGVRVPRPRLPPALQNLDLVPVAVFGGEALGANLAGGQQNVGVMIALVPLAPRRVQGDISHHATVHELRLCVVADQGDPLRPAYWNVLEVYERALKREMYLGDQDDTFFRLDLPTNKTDWPGTFTLIGNSGAGKTYWVVQMLLRYLRATKPHARRTIIWCSPEWEIDKTLKPLKETKYSFNVMGVDIGEDALRKSGKDAMTYYNEKIKRVIDEHGEKAIIVLDDFVDAAPALYPFLRKIYISSLRTARHKVTSVISLQHTYSGGKNTSQAIQSNKFIVFFPRSQQNRCIMFMRDHLMMQTAEAKELVQRFAKLDRWMTIRLHSPAAIYNSKYLLLL